MVKEKNQPLQVKKSSSIEKQNPSSQLLLIDMYSITTHPGSPSRAETPTVWREDKEASEGSLSFSVRGGKYDYTSPTILKDQLPSYSSKKPRPAQHIFSTPVQQDELSAPKSPPPTRPIVLTTPHPSSPSSPVPPIFSSQSSSQNAAPRYKLHLSTHRPSKKRA
jgi:hypothetical protein